MKKKTKKKLKIVQISHIFILFRKSPKRAKSSDLGTKSLRVRALNLIVLLLLTYWDTVLFVCMPAKILSTGFQPGAARCREPLLEVCE